jgi:hypothetical protein
MVSDIISPHAGVAQLFRALPCQGRGRELESLHPHHPPSQTLLGSAMEDFSDQALAPGLFIRTKLIIVGQYVIVLP